MAQDIRYDSQKEGQAFDKQVEERISMGYIPDLRRLQFVEGLYNNPWREPEFVYIQLMPKINFVIGIAQRRGGRVLDLGCGMGYLSLELARNGLDVDAVDISSKSIEIARKYLSQNTYTEGFGSLNYWVDDVTSMDMGKEKYCSIVSMGTIHHLPNLPSLFARASEALEPGGNLILCEPIRSKFTKESAEFAAILRSILPTWIPYEEKLNFTLPQSWEKFVQEVYDEYTYVDKKGENVQSPYDNIASSDEEMISGIKEYFDIKQIGYSGAFIDKIIGGLRGPYRYSLAKFLKFLDNDLVRRHVLPPTNMCLWAMKK